MKLLIKNLRVRLAALGAVGLAVVCFFAFSGEGEVQPKTETDVHKAETSSVKTTSAVQVYKFAQYKKAHINEYDMSKTETKVVAERKDTSVKTNEFIVKFPKGEDTVYNEKYPPLYFNDTRSVAEEYYTVHDIISGEDVTLDGHEMLCRLVNSEIGDGWGEEAIKAQTVAAYSYLRFCDSIGLIPDVGLKDGYSLKLENCVNAVEGQVICHNGGIINAVYSASTAGYSTSAANIWGVEYPYLQCVKSKFDSDDPNWGTVKVYTEEQIRKKILSAFKITLSDTPENWFDVLSCFSGKYIKEISVDGQKTVSGNAFCNALDIKSNAMDISFKDGKFTFTSYGWGHGVGMSQWGACLYAKNGWTYDQILRHYYINTTIELSSVNQKAVDRGNMSDEEREEEAAAASREDKNKAVAVNNDKENDAVETDAKAEEKNSSQVTKDNTENDGITADTSRTEDSHADETTSSDDTEDSSQADSNSQEEYDSESSSETEIQMQEE